MQRYDVVNSFLRSRNKPTYLEIGLATGEAWFRVRATKKMGVDPRDVFTSAKVKWHRKLLFEISRQRGARFWAMTSDDFFEKKAADIFKNEKIDAVLVDGWHSYEQSLKDVRHCLEYLKDDGLIVVHDCNPAVAAATAATPEEALELPGSNGFWNGDVWKTIVHLRSTRSDLNIEVLDTDHGLGLIRFGKPASVLSYTTSDIESMTYHDLAQNRREFLNINAPDFLRNKVYHLG